MRMAAPQPDWPLNEVTRRQARQQLEEAINRIQANPPAPGMVEKLENNIYTQSNSRERYIQSIKTVIQRANLKAQQIRSKAMPQPSQPMSTPQLAGNMPHMPQPNRYGINQAQQRVPSDSPQSMQSPLSSGGITGYSPDSRMPHPSPGQQYYPRNMLQRTPQQQQPPQQNIQQPPLRMPDHPYQNTPHGSVGSIGSTYIPSLSPAHPNNSPQVASSPALRTPSSVTVAHSPAEIAAPSPSTNQTQMSPPQTDEQAYVEKLKQLQKYIEPLSRMINKQEKNSKDLSKMKNLRDVLMDPQKRLPMQTLQKCENVLRSWLDKPLQPPPTTKSDQHMCQPILDAVAANINSPMMNHTLKRTFSQALQTLNGDYKVPPNVCSKRHRIEKSVAKESAEIDIRVPDLIQGEVARLGAKFKVTIDLSRSSNAGTLHLICKLEDPSMPAVPPICLLVPSNYPKEGPEWKSWDCDSNDNGPESITSFLDRLKPCMETHINSAMDRNETITAILFAWERSVKETVLSQSQTEFFNINAFL